MMSRKTDDDANNREERLPSSLLPQVLPACQPQEDSPALANTFANGERLEPQTVLAHVPLTSLNATKAFDIGSEDMLLGDEAAAAAPTLNWYGAPKKFESELPSSQLRQRCRSGAFCGPTNASCPGFLQCNLVILPAEFAFEFLLFCQRNPQACPLIEVCEKGSPHPVGVALDADLRTDLPKYAIYRDGQLDCEVSDITGYWRDDLVSFLIGCSFSYDEALVQAGIPLRSAEQGRNVPMFTSNLKCRPAGRFYGPMVVSMKPIPAALLKKHVEITSQYKHAHGGPICIGQADAIGIRDINQPHWGEPVAFRPDEVAVFHACGVTPQAVLRASKIPFAITHAAGHMFVTDLPSDMGVVQYNNIPGGALIPS